MANPLSVLIVAPTRSVGVGVREMLGAGEAEIHTEIVIGTQLARAARHVDALIVAPIHWEDLAAWMPALRERYFALPWLVLADLRLAGAFFRFDETMPRTLVPLGPPPGELRAALQALIAGHPPRPPADLLRAYASPAPRPPRGRALPLPTAAELQCGCALSFGLSNAQMARIMGVQEATVKTELRRLRARLRHKRRPGETGRHYRERLAAHFRRGDERAASRGRRSSSMKGVQRAFPLGGRKHSGRQRTSHQADARAWAKGTTERHAERRATYRLWKHIGRRNKRGAPALPRKRSRRPTQSPEGLHSL